MEDFIISNVQVYGLEESIKASKYPMAVDISKLDSDLTEMAIKLAQSDKGEGHDNWLNGIVVQFDLTYTIKAWTEAERYHFFDFVSSQSTMHRIAKFNLDESYIEYTDKRMIEIMNELVDIYNADPTPENYLKLLYSNPCGFRLTARMTTNYRQLKTMYAQRKNHRLPEWKWFCEWVKSLPKSHLITESSRKNVFTPNEYQKLAARTINGNLSTEEIAYHALHGMVGEIGELHSIYQKEFQGHEMDKEHVKKELGDLLWFVAEYCTAQQWWMEDIMKMNIDKLIARYPDGFDSEHSIHREAGDI